MFRNAALIPRFSKIEKRWPTPLGAEYGTIYKMLKHFVNKHSQEVNQWRNASLNVKPGQSRPR